MQTQCSRLKRLLFGVAFTGILLLRAEVHAKEEETLKNGIQIGLTESRGDLDLSGMTAIEAENAITEYVSEIREMQISLVYDEEHEVVVSAGDLGIVWKNPGIIEEALNLGNRGNVVKRYKLLKDLEHDKKVYVLEFEADKRAIYQLLDEKCIVFDKEPIDYSLKRENVGEKNYAYTSSDYFCCRRFFDKR